MGLAVGFISVLLYIWDFITYPVYLLIDRPWTKTRYVLSSGDLFILLQILGRWLN